MADTSLIFNVLAKDKASKTFDRIKGAAMAAGPAIGLALAAGVASAFEKEKVSDRLAAQLGDAPWAADAGKAASSLYLNAWTDSAAEAGDAVRAVMQGGLLGGKATAAEIENITAKAASLAKTFDQEVGATSRAASQLVRTGVAGSAEEALDILTAGFRATGDLAGDLLDTFSEYSTKLRGLGLNGKVAMGLLAQGTRAGARDVDTVADALKEFNILATNGSKASAAGFKAIGLDAQKMTAQIAAGGPGAAAGLDTVLDRLRAMKDPVAQNAAAVALFGTKAEDLGGALFALDPSSAVDALGQVEGAAGKLSGTLHDNAATKLEAFKRQAQSALVEQLAKAVPTLESMLGFMTRNADVIVPLVGALTGFVAIVYAITAAVKIYTAVQWLLNIAMNANPVGLIIIAIVALIAGIVLLWNHSAGFRNFFIGAWEGIKNAASAVGQWFSGTLWPWLKGIFFKIGEVLTWPVRFGIAKFTQLIAWFKTLPGKIGAIFKTVGEFLTRPFRMAFNAIAGFWNRTIGRMRFQAPDWVPGIGGKGFNMPQLPMLESGGVIRRGGAAIVADRNGSGGEVVHLPTSAQVTPLSRTGGGTTLEFTSDGSRLGDLLVEMIRETVRVKGRGNVQVAFGRR